MPPSPSGCWLGPRIYSFSRPQCVHCCYSLVTGNLPWEDLVDRLRRFCFHLLRYPNYGALTSTPAGLSPTEHAGLHWTHNRTCRFAGSGSRTRRHAFTHDGPRPRRVRRHGPEVLVKVREGIAPALASPDPVLELEPPAQPHSRVVVERAIGLADGADFRRSVCGMLPK